MALVEPTAEEFAAVSSEFDLHELAVEDAVKAHQRPKLERYGNVLFVVLKTVVHEGPVEMVETGQVMLFVGLGLPRLGAARAEWRAGWRPRVAGAAARAARARPERRACMP